ncbi:MAG TPA: tetratricopeptide repeat protein [Kofleriaceae bacterium]
MRGYLVVAALLGALGSAHADSTDQKKADALFEQGRALIEAHDDAGACGKFNEAIKLDPDAAGTMLNLGLCNQNLKKYRLALYWFRKAQARAHETNLPEYEKAAGIHTTDIIAWIATVKVEVNTPDVRVKIDGEVISPEDYLRIEIDGGHHVLDASAPGHRSSHQEFEVTGKGGKTLHVNLEVGDDSVVIDRGSNRRKIAVYTAIGGGLLMVASGVVSLVERSDYNHCVSDNMVQLQNSGCTYDSVEHDRKVARWVGTPLFAAGAVAVGVAAFVYLTAPTRERVNQTAFVPTVSGDGVGLAAVGRF